MADDAAEGAPPIGAQAPKTLAKERENERADDSTTMDDVNQWPAGSTGDASRMMKMMMMMKKKKKKKKKKKSEVGMKERRKRCVASEALPWLLGGNSRYKRQWLTGRTSPERSRLANSNC